MHYSFGECTLDTESRALTRKGEPAHLSPKAFELLRVLLERRPRVVRKRELMSALWPDTFVVEANLPVIVGEVRDAIGDLSADPRAIKTHHGIGYSFTASVTESRSLLDPLDQDGWQVFLRIGKRRIVLAPGPNIVGRDPDCDVYIKDASVSRNHARITVKGGSATLVDLGSKNGTRYAGVLLEQPTELADGDELVFGTVQARVFVTSRNDPMSTMTLTTP
jgi:DNA-binding winged helix-turn-helix (wHTH) protein